MDTILFCTALDILMLQACSFDMQTMNIIFREKGVFIRMGAFITINMVSKWYSEKKNANINIIFISSS